MNVSVPIYNLMCVHLPSNKRSVLAPTISTTGALSI